MTCTTEKTYTYTEISDAVDELAKHLERVHGRTFAFGYIKASYAGALAWPMREDSAFLMRRLDEWKLEQSLEDWLEETNRFQTHCDIMAEVYEAETAHYGNH